MARSGETVVDNQERFVGLIAHARQQRRGVPDPLGANRGTGTRVARQ